MANKKSAILVVDDEHSVRQSLRLLLKDDHEVLLAPGPVEGQFHLSCSPVDLALLDIRLKDTDGLSMLINFKQQYPDLEVIMITAYASLDTIRKAIRFGAYDYLIKPFNKDELTSAVKRALKRRKNKLLIKSELYKLRESTLYLEELMIDAQSTMISSSENIMTAILHNIDSKDGYTWDHVQRVTDMSGRIADSLGLTEEEKQWLKCSAFLHDIGKININTDILKNNGDLNDYEYEIMKRHPDEGAEIISSIPVLKRTIPSIRHHHEKFDGTGYPEGLKGSAIPFNSRILAVADAIDSMHNSPLRKHPCGSERIKEELHRYAGLQFDPDIVTEVVNGSLLSF